MRSKLKRKLTFTVSSALLLAGSSLAAGCDDREGASTPDKAPQETLPSINPGPERDVELTAPRPPQPDTSPAPDTQPPSNYGKETSSLSVNVRSRARLKPSKPQVTGALDSRIIRKVLNQNKRALKTCYEREILKNPRLQGTVEYRWVIDGEGRVESVEPGSTTMEGPGADAVGACLAEVIQDMRYPAPKDGEKVTVVYPLVFTNE